MPLFTTPDGRYTVAWETEGEGEGNSVIYDRAAPGGPYPWPGLPIWDRFSYEASLAAPQPPPLPPSPPVPHPVPPLPPLPAAQPGIPIRVSTDQDGPLAKRMMSYWANAFRADASRAYVFAGSLASGGPIFWEVDLASRRSIPRGPLALPYRGETEGWYWDLQGRILLYDGPRFRRVDPFTNEGEVLYDLSADPRFADCQVWQPHSSLSGRTHSATVQRRVSDGPYPNIGTVVFHDGVLDYFEAHGTLDESHLIGDDWVDIHETPEGQQGEDNRVIHLRTRDTRLIKDAERALGHSDAGSDWMVGEADKPDPGQCGWWDLTQPLTPGRFHPLFTTLNMGYVAVHGTTILHSSDTDLRLIDRDSGQVQTLYAHGGGTAYDDRVKASFSPDGSLVCYMVGGQVYLLQLS